MKAPRKRPPSFRAIALRLSTLILALWLGCMVLLTWAVASDMHRQLKNQTRSYAAYRSGSVDVPTGVDLIGQLGQPYNSLRIEQLLPIVLPQTPDSYGSDDWFWGKWDLLYGFEAAEIFYDGQGQVLLQTGSYMTFAYTDPESWQAGKTGVNGHGYLALDGLDSGLEQYLPEFPSGGAVLNSPVLRLTGFFDGTQFHPTLIEQASPQPGERGSGVDVERTNRLDLRGHMDWEVLFSEDIPADRTLQTLYAWDLGGIASRSKPVTAGGTQYDSLTALLRDAPGQAESDSLWESVFIASSTHESADGSFTYAIALRCKPIQYAALRLIPAYLCSLALVLLCLGLLLGRIRRSLTKPLAQLVSYDLADVDGAWAEPHALQQRLTDTRQALAEAKNQLQQLQTSLDFARNAEENRRQLVSSMAHELKTPLAVIHSYAEGLQADIAGEKRERYLGVLLEETERMDAMVLHMLELSRLEAGKVRLTIAPFSLLKLTRSVAEKLTPLAEAKGLELRYPIAEEFQILADEGRMEQVVTNLLSNAIKYSPPGGTIHIKVFSRNGSARFLMENPAPPLSEEALEKVWDSFYRADPSRTEPGTGLGLTLVKSIVQLHGGSCSVRNTKAHPEDPLPTGVEFGFTLPIT